MTEKTTTENLKSELNSATKSSVAGPVLWLRRSRPERLPHLLVSPEFFWSDWLHQPSCLTVSEHALLSRLVMHTLSHAWVANSSLAIHHFLHSFLPTKPWWVFVCLFYVVNDVQEQVNVHIFLFSSHPSHEHPIIIFTSAVILANPPPLFLPFYYLERRNKRTIMVGVCTALMSPQKNQQEN